MANIFGNTVIGEGLAVLIRFLFSISQDWKLGMISYDANVPNPRSQRMFATVESQYIGSSSLLLDYLLANISEYGNQNIPESYWLSNADIYSTTVMALQDGTWRPNANRLIVYITGRHSYDSAPSSKSIIDISAANASRDVTIMSYNYHDNQDNEIIMRDLTDRFNGIYTEPDDNNVPIIDICDYIAQSCGLNNNNCEKHDITYIVPSRGLSNNSYWMFSLIMDNVLSEFSTSRARIITLTSNGIDVDLNWTPIYDVLLYANLITGVVFDIRNKYENRNDDIPVDALYTYYTEHNNSWRITASRTICLFIQDLRYSDDIVDDIILDAKLKKIRYYIIQTPDSYNNNNVPIYQNADNLIKLAESTDGVFYTLTDIIEESGNAAQVGAWGVVLRDKQSDFFIRCFDGSFGQGQVIQSAQKLSQNSKSSLISSSVGYDKLVINQEAYANPIMVDMNDGRYIVTIESTTFNTDGNYSVPIVIDYNRNGAAKRTRFLNKGLFDSAHKANDIYSGLTTVFEHSGGEVKFGIDSQFFSDISGEVNLIISRDNEYDIENSNIQQIQSDDNLTCVMNSNKIRWYEKGWKENRGCGCVISISGQDYIVIKRSIGDDSSCGGGESISSDCIKSVTDKYGHPAIAWPTFDGFNFVNVPNADVVFKFDKKYNDVSLTLINNGMYEKHIGHVQNIGCVIFPVQ